MAEKYIPFYTGDDLSALAQFEQIAAAQEALATEITTAGDDLSKIGVQPIGRNYATPEVIAGGAYAPGNTTLVPLYQAAGAGPTFFSQPGAFSGGNQYGWSFPDAQITRQAFAGEMARGINANTVASVNFIWLPAIAGFGNSGNVHWRINLELKGINNFKTGWFTTALGGLGPPIWTGRDIQRPANLKASGLGFGLTNQLVTIPTSVSAGFIPQWHYTVIDIDVRNALPPTHVALTIDRLGADVLDTWSFGAFVVSASLTTSREGVGNFIPAQGL